MTILFGVKWSLFYINKTVLIDLNACMFKSEYMKIEVIVCYDIIDVNLQFTFLKNNLECVWNVHVRL